MKSEATRKRIISAAKECFDRYGEKRVSLEDVSKHAGVHRQTIYRLFKSRDELRDAVVFQCMEDVASTAQRTLAQCGTLKEAIVQGTLATVEQALADKSLMDLIRSDWAFAYDLLESNTHASKYFDGCWKPIFIRAQQSGEITADWKYADFSQWLRGGQFVLLLRDQLTRNKRIKLLNQMIQPSFTK